MAASQPPATGKGRSPSREMTASDVLAVLDALRSRGITVWVHGGWGVDALLGAQSRDHDDLDLVVQLADWPRISRVLGDLGYRVAQGSPPANTVLLDAIGRQVDLHPVRFDARGAGIYRTEAGDDWPFPAAAFAGRGVIAGREVRCLTPEFEVTTHAGYELDDHDRADVAALVARFGVVPPTGP